MSLSTFCTGYVAVFVGLPSTGGTTAPQLLGTGESPPETSMRKTYIPVMNDISGGAEPFDELAMGRSAISQIEINFFDEAVLQRLEAMVPLANSIDDGQETAQDRGTLMAAEGRYTAVYFLAARRNVAAMAVAGMPAGFCYPYSTITSVARRPGNKASSAALTFQHRSIWQRRSGRFLLRHGDMTAVANIRII